MKKIRMFFVILSMLSIVIANGWAFASGSIDTEKKRNQGQSDLEKRLNLLESALVSQSPREVANTWAKGVMTRNGALQYAVLCDNLRSKYKSDFESANWQPGVSSPWVDSYQMSGGKQLKGGAWKFTIRFHYTDSTKSVYSRISDITIGPVEGDGAPLSVYSGSGQKWCIILINWDDYQSL